VTGGQAPFAAFFRAFEQYDWEGMRRELAPEMVFDDHRTLGLGKLDRDQWVASLRALADLGRDLAAEMPRVLAWNRHGLVAVTRTFGTVPDGGPFENVFVSTVLTDGDCIQRYEVFDVADADRALARFAELSGENGGMK
jgi:ketosteroid isomerase-like protein